MKRLLLFVMCLAAFAQEVKIPVFPSRQFKYGEELKSGFLTVRVLRGVGVVVQSTDTGADYVEVVLGFETEIELSPNVTTKILKFETYSSPLPMSAVGTSLSIGPELKPEKLAMLRTVRAVLLKARSMGEWK